MKHYRPITHQAHRPNTRPNYRKIIEAAIKNGTMAPAPGTASTIEILHDDWCVIYQGEPCNCDPDIIQHPSL
jgi:hypothetical protein